MICESLYPLSNFRRVMDSLPRKSARITLADRTMASPAVIMKERRICWITLVNRVKSNKGSLALPPAGLLLREPVNVRLALRHPNR